MADGDRIAGVLSASGGQGIKVTSTTSGAADTIHTVSTDTDVTEWITLHACNTSLTVEAILTVMFGGTTNPDHYIVAHIRPSSGLVTVTSRLPLTGGASIIVKAFADNANIVNVYGDYVSGNFA